MRALRWYTFGLTYWPSDMADSCRGDTAPHTCVDHMEVSSHRSNYRHGPLTTKLKPNLKPILKAYVTRKQA